ncbi:MAG: hypothetical protein AAFW98_16470, partial [Pseudomonadota bacterium]
RSTAWIKWWWAAIVKGHGTLITLVTVIGDTGRAVVAFPEDGRQIIRDAWIRCDLRVGVKPWWELSAIASVVVGGTLLTGGMGSVPATVAGALLLGLVFNILNFENGRGTISLSAYWQLVVRGAFLFLVIALQTRIAAPDKTGERHP